MRDAAPKGTYKVQALDRAFAVLDLLGESEIPLGLAQVASALELHKSTAHRFLMVLERHHMVERTATGKFRLGLRLFDFGSRAIEQYDLRDRAQPHLRKLVMETEETAHLCILEQAHIIYLDRADAGCADDYKGGRKQSGALHFGGQGDSGVYAGGTDRRCDSTDEV
jgi:DNA-binding IclR family transcriptional regulator